MKRYFISGYNYIQDIVLEAGTYTFWAYIKSDFGNTFTFALANEANEWEVFDVDVQQGQWTKAHEIFTIKEKKVRLSLIYRYFDEQHPVYVLKPQLIKGNIPSDAGSSPFDIDRVTDDLHDAIGGIEDFTNEEFADRVLSSGERVSLRRDLEAVEVIFQGLKGSYEKLLINPFVNALVLADLTAKYNAVSSAKDNLFTTLNTIIAGDNIVTPEEIAAKDLALSSLNNALYAYNTAEKEIANALGEDYTQQISAIRDFTDTEFNDRRLSETEKVSLSHDLDTIQTLLDKITAGYNEIVLNPYLTVADITLLTDKYNALFDAWDWDYDIDPSKPDGLKTVILDIINGDEIVTQAEIDEKDLALSNFNVKLGEYSTTEAQMLKFAVDNLHIGGRNLLRDSLVVTDRTYPSSGVVDMFNGVSTIPLIEDEYVVSFEAKSTVSGDRINCYFYNPETTTRGESSLGSVRIAVDGAMTIPLQTEWRRYWIKYTQSETTTVKRVIVGRLIAGEGSGVVSIRNIQLEKGNKATDWTPAPEDVQAEIDAAQTTADNAQLAADGYMKARYVRDWIQGSTANTSNQWNEIKVIRKDGTNVAQGKTPSSNGTFDASYPAANATDNNINTYAQINGTTPATSNYIRIDLGQVYNDIDYIQIWHYYQDGRTYYGTKTEISVDGITWTTIYDSATMGTYKETIGGKTHSQRYNRIVSEVNRSKAITDKFGTRIDGGLISTVITEYRELDSPQVTGLISGIQGTNKDLPFLVAGGTYSQAVDLIEFLYNMSIGTPAGTGVGEYDYASKYPQLAKISMLHNGAGKYGDFIVLQNGAVIIIDPDTGQQKVTFGVNDLPALADLLSEISPSEYKDYPATTSSGDLGSGITVTVDGATVEFGTQPGDTRVNFSLSATYAEGAPYHKITSTLDLMKDGVFYLRISSIEIDNYQTSTNVPILKLSFTNCPAGTYTIVKSIHHDPIPEVTNVVNSIGRSRLSWEFIQSGVRRFQFGRNGFMSVYSMSHLYMSETEGLDIKGKTNTPGVLLSATVASAGGWNYIWGAKKSETSPVKNSTGRYTVYHTVGHSNYQIFSTPHSSSRSCHIVSKGATNFVVEWRTIGSSPSLIDTTFDFQIVGDNYP